MGRKRIVVVIVMLMAFGVSTTSGVATAGKPASDGFLSPSRGSGFGRCSDLLLIGGPSGAAHCDSHSGSASTLSRVLSVDSRASTTSEDDGAGLLSFGQGLARGSGSLGYDSQLKGSASKVTVTVQVSGINAAASSNSPTSRGDVWLYAHAWPNASFRDSSSGRLEIVTVAASDPFRAAPPFVQGGTHTFELVLEAVRVKSYINIRVGLVADSEIGFVTCFDSDLQGQCDQAHRETHDGSGIATASGSAVVSSVKVETTP